MGTLKGMLSDVFAVERRANRVRRLMRISVVEGVFATLYLLLTSGAFLTGYALFLGANDFQLGLLAAIPFIAQVFQVPGAYLTERTGHRKRLAVATFGISRISYIFLAVIPFIGIFSGNFKLFIVISLVGIAAALTTAGNNAWTGWMGDMIPDKMRGRYFANRNLVLSIVNIVTSLGGARILDHYKSTGMEAFGFSLIFSIAVVAGLISVVLLLVQPARRMKLVIDEGFFERLMEPLRDKNYRKVLLFFTLFFAGIGFSMGFFAPHMINNLKMSYFEISIFSGIISLTAMLSYRIWGKIIDKAGNRPVLISAVLAISVLPLIWVLPSEQTLWIIYPFGVLAGIFWSAFNLCAFNLPLATSPRENRSYYLAVYGVFTGIILFLASAIAGFFAHSISDFKFVIGPITVINYHLLFIISGVLRLLSLIFLRRVKESGDIGVAGMVYMVRSAVRQRVVTSFHTIPAMAARIIPHHKKQNEKNEQEVD